MPNRTTLLKLIQQSIEQHDDVEFVDRYHNRVKFRTTMNQVGVPSDLAVHIGERSGRLMSSSGKNMYGARVSPQD